MSYTNKILYNESCINDAYFAVFSSLKKRSETPKKQSRPVSIWDLDINEDSTSNRRFSENIVNYNSKYSEADSNDSYGKISFYEEGDEAIWGNITDSKFSSVDRNNTCEDKNSVKSPNIHEKLSYENGRLMKNSIKPEDHQSLRLTYRGRLYELKTDQEKDEKIVNVSGKIKKVSFQNSTEKLNTDVEMVAVTFEENSKYQQPYQNKIEDMDIARSKNKIISPENYVPRKRPCISEISSFDPHPNSAVSNLFDKFASTDSKENISSDKPLKEEKSPLVYENSKYMKIERESQKVHDVLKEKNKFEKIQRMSSEIKSLLNIPQDNMESDCLVGKQDISLMRKSKVFAESETAWKKYGETTEDNRLIRSKASDENSAQNIGTVHQETLAGEKESPLKDKDLHSKSPTLNKFEKTKSPSYNDWLKEREAIWKSKRNLDYQNDRRDSSSSPDTIIETESRCKNKAESIKNSITEYGLGNKNIIKTVKNTSREDQLKNRNSSSAVKDSVNEDSCSSTSDDSRDFANECSPDPVKSHIREDKYKSKNGSLLTKSSGNRKVSVKNHLEEKKTVRKSAVSLEDRTCSEKEAIICVQVTDQNKTSDLTVEERMLEHMKTRRPEIMQLFPLTNSKTEEIPYSCEAVMIVLRYLFSSYQKISNWKVALEVLSLSIKYNLKRLKKISEQYFVENPPTLQNVEEIIHNAVYLKVLHNLNNVVKIKGISLYQFLCNTSLSTEFQFISSSCSISAKLLVEQSEFCIPLCPVNHDFSAAFKKDIRNVLTFEAMKGNYVLTGIQIKFDVHSVDMVNIEYRVLKGNQIVVSDEKEKRLRSLIILNFGKDILVQPSEKVEISIMIEDIQPRICSGASTLKFVQNSNGCHFTTVLSSNVSPCLIFIEKLFYTVSL